MIRTRVGYAGGTKEDPTYSSLGDHSETIQIDFNPGQISYQDLLGVFWGSHRADVNTASCQYKSVIFYHNEEQRRLAEEIKVREEGEKGIIFTEIVPFSNFYLAEDYHQKWSLRQVEEITAEYKAIYPDAGDFINSTAVTRVNGYIDGHGELEDLHEELDSLGLSDAGKEMLLEYYLRRSNYGN